MKSLNKTIGVNKAIDINFLREAIGNDVEFEKELFNIFLESANKNTFKLRNSLTSKDNTLWYEAAHALRGSASIIGAFELSRALEDAQDYFKDGLTKKNKILKSIERELEIVVTFIKNIH